MFGLKQSHIDAINACFAQHASIEQVLIYGSRAKGNFKPGSDIDLTIVSQNMSYSELLDLENALDDLLLPYKIDLSLNKQISNPDLKEHIERIGQVFFDPVYQSVLNEPPEGYKSNPDVKDKN